MKQLTYIFLFFSLMLNSQISNLGLEFNQAVDAEIKQIGSSKFMVVAEKGGNIFVCDYINNSWQKRPQPIITLNAVAENEKGVQDITLVANFVVVSYNTADVIRVSRFDVNYFSGFVDPEDIILEIPSISSNHQSASLVIHEDYLFIAIGDGASGFQQQAAIDAGLLPANQTGITKRYRAQNLDNPFGKILRVFFHNGNAPFSNPFYDGNNTSWRSRIWHIGFRNPYRMVSDSNGNLIITDVGELDKEEINIASCLVPGENFGWGKYEGFNIYEAFGNDYTINQATSFSTPNTLSERIETHQFPQLDYGHIGNAETRMPDFTNSELTPITLDNAIQGNSIIGGCVVANGFLFTDFVSGWLKLATFNTSEGRYFEDVVNIENVNVSTPVSMFSGPDYTYIVSLTQGIFRLDNNTLNVIQPKASKAKITYLNNIISVKNECNYTLSVYDVQGRKLIETKTNSCYSQTDISALSKGFYIVKVVSNNTQITKKILK